jgi:hypothetical protein
MSAGSRQEVLIRALIEALCLCLKGKLEGQPRQRPKVEAAERVEGVLEALWNEFPIDLTQGERRGVVTRLDQFHDLQGHDSEFHRPEVLISLTLGLSDRLARVITNPRKAALVGELNQALTALYDTFDRQAKKLEALEVGGKLADRVLAM